MMQVLHRARVLFRHRELLGAFVRKDFELRYAGSFLGVLWTQVYPLLLLGVYILVFGVIFPNDIPRFPIFLFAGIALWNFFGSAALLASSSVLANAPLITKVAFPREIVTIAAVVVPLIDLALSHGILLAGALALGVAPAWSWLALAPVVLLLVAFSIGVGLVLATATVYYRDVRFFVEVGVLLLMFVSGVFFRPDMVPVTLAWMMEVNPLAVTLQAYRGALLDGVWPPVATWAKLGLFAAAALWLGMAVFDRGQRGFPDAL
jgi:ABC-type polysaccharide/polyol phosphate export permease